MVAFGALGLVELGCRIVDERHGANVVGDCDHWNGGRAGNRGGSGDFVDVLVGYDEVAPDGAGASKFAAVSGRTERGGTGRGDPAHPDEAGRDDGDDPERRGDPRVLMVAGAVAIVVAMVSTAASSPANSGAVAALRSAPMTLSKSG